MNTPNREPYPPHGQSNPMGEGLPPIYDGRDGRTQHLPYQALQPGRPYGAPSGASQQHDSQANPYPRGYAHPSQQQPYGGASQHTASQQHSHAGYGGYGQTPPGSGHYGSNVHGAPVSHQSAASPYGSHAAYGAHGGQTSHPYAQRGAQPMPQGTPFGKYLLLSELGRGGMGVVYRAYQTDLKRECALKVLHDANGERLVQEGQAVAKLGKHSNIVTVYDAGIENGVPFIAMEFVKGTPLDDYLEEHGPLPEQRVLEIGYKVALALHHAHRQGVIHRDMKPANIILDEHGEPHVLDFGLAADVVTGEAMYAGSIVGTPGYMPPEQFRPEPGAVDARSDVYALGATLYHLLSGRAPFEGEIRHVLQQLLTRDPEPLRAITACSRDLETVIAKAMEKDPRDRYQSCLEFAEDLSRVLAGEPPKSRRLGVLGRSFRKAQRHPALLTVGLLLAIFGVVAGLWLRHEREQADRLWQDLSRQVAQQTAERTRAMLAPAVPLLEETLLFAKQGLIPIPPATGTLYPVELRRDLARDLAIRFRVRNLDWMTFVEPDGRFTGVTRRDGRIIANYSWIEGQGKDKASWEVEEEVDENGNFLEIGRDKQTGDDVYDPRLEASYVVAKDRDTPVWTDPYEWDVEASQGGGTEWGMSYCAPFRKGKQLVGVFTADFTLADLSRFLAEITTEPHARSFLITDEGRIAARSDAVAGRVEPSDPLLSAALAKLDHGVASLQETRPVTIDFRYGGERYAAALAKFTLPGDLAWATAVIAPLSALRGRLEQQTQWMLYAGVAGLLVLIIGLVLVVLRRRKHVRQTVRTFGGPSSVS